MTMELLFFNVINAYDYKRIYIFNEIEKYILLSVCHRSYIAIHKQHSFINFYNKNRRVLKNSITL